MSLVFLSDEQIIKRIAEGCKHKRLSLDLSQVELAKKANLSIGVIRKFESASASSFRTILGIFKALGEIDKLQSLILETAESPKEIFEREQIAAKKKLRASRGRK